MDTKKSEFIKKWESLQSELICGVDLDIAMNKIFSFIDKEVMQVIDKKLKKNKND